jgi:hypothetical protein
VRDATAPEQNAVGYGLKVLSFKVFEPKNDIAKCTFFSLAKRFKITLRWYRFGATFGFAKQTKGSEESKPEHSIPEHFRRTNNDE